jgi:hypothetical protein
MQPLFEAEKLFYETGMEPAEAIAVIDRHLERLQHFARYILTHIHASVLGDPRVLTNAPFIASLKLRNLEFDAEAMRAAYAPWRSATETYQWNLNPAALEELIVEQETVST